MGLGVLGDFRICEWDDGCLTLVHPDDINAPLCEVHDDEARREERADTLRKQQKEDETWNN